MHGRVEEQAAIDALLAAARNGESGALVFEGEPGIGKTCMCEYAAGHASDFTVVRACGIVSEYGVPFAGLCQLLGPLVGCLDEIPLPQRNALRGAMALEPPSPASPLALGAATLSLLAAAAELRPVLALVDDVQWLDAASAQAISFAVRHLGREAVAIVVAQRSDDGHPFEVGGLAPLRIGALPTDAGQALLAEVAGAAIPPVIARAIVEATAGNPLALIDVARTLPLAALTGREPLPDPLRVEGDIEVAFAKRIAELPERTRQALVVLAAESSGSLVVVGPALERLGLGTETFEPAELAGVLAYDGLTLSFKHPLIRAAAYHGATVTQQRSAHRALATATAATGDAEREAWHLAAAATGADERVAATLERTAERARGIGGATAAAAGWKWLRC